MPTLDPSPPTSVRALHLSWVGALVDGVTGRARRRELPPFALSLGLDPRARRALLAALPAQERAALPLSALEMPGEPADPPTLLAPLCALLEGHRVADDPLWTLAGRAPACGCFGSRHLWQDLGVAGRDDVTRLLNAGFATLAAGNVRNLKWKRYLFLALGRQRGEADLRPPRCDRCDEFANCFGEPPAEAPMRVGRRTDRSAT